MNLLKRTYIWIQKLFELVKKKSVKSKIDHSLDYYFDFYRDNSPELTQLRKKAVVVNGQLYDYRDGQNYKVVVIDNRIWMAENLNFWTPLSCWYNNDPDLGKIFGRLYTFNDALIACPPGWHLPTAEEWHAMMNCFGGCYEYERNPGEAAYNILLGNGHSGFNALLGGRHDPNFGWNFTNINKNGLYWSSTPSRSFSEKAVKFEFFSKNFRNEPGTIYRGEIFTGYGLSVRCVKD